MTNLEALKATLKDQENKIMSDEEYRSHLELKGINPDDMFDPGNPNDIMLAKADILEDIVAHPLKWNAYKQGEINEEVNPEQILKVAQQIRLRYQKVI